MTAPLAVADTPVAEPETPRPGGDAPSGQAPRGGAGVTRPRRKVRGAKKRAKRPPPPIDTSIVDDPALAEIPATDKRPPALVRKTEAGREAQALHERIAERVKGIETSYMALAADLVEAWRQSLWQFFRDATGTAYSEPEPYFVQHFGLRIRTVLRLRAIHEAVERLPEAERPQAIEALGRIGSHKAGVLVPVLGNSERPWQEWVAEAGRLTEKALQVQVSTATGAAPRGTAAHMPDYGAQFMDRVIGGLSPTEQTRCRAIWMAWDGLQAALSGKSVPMDPRAGLVLLFDQAEVELGHHGVQVRA